VIHALKSSLVLSILLPLKTCLSLQSQAGVIPAILSEQILADW